MLKHLSDVDGSASHLGNWGPAWQYFSDQPREGIHSGFYQAMLRQMHQKPMLIMSFQFKTTQLCHVANSNHFSLLHSDENNAGSFLGVICHQKHSGHGEKMLSSLSLLWLTHLHNAAPQLGRATQQGSCRPSGAPAIDIATQTAFLPPLLWLSL